MANIGLSIVRGSAIGPTVYIVMQSDLHVISCINVIIKFADDTTLLVPENTDVGLYVEFRHVSEWAESNRLTLNTGNTKEIVLRRHQVKYFHMPPATDCIEQVNCCKLLVFFNPVLRWIHMCNIFSHSVYRGCIFSNYYVVRECLLCSFPLLRTVLLCLVCCMLLMLGEVLSLPSIITKINAFVK